MKWLPSACRAGDMVRVRLGALLHYGIFVSEEEVIQFGLPPVAPRKDDEVRVCASTIDEFCVGQIVEVARLDRAEKKARIAPEETVRLARARLGEGGYNLIHNNCEHFAYQCVFGTKRSLQEEDARRRWNTRPICDVYVAPIPLEPVLQPVVSPARRRALEKTRDTRLLVQRQLAWNVLEYAAQRSFSIGAEELTFRQTRFGGWTCGAFHFSISHTRDCVVVALSNHPVGVDVEHIGDFTAKFGADTDVFRAAAGKITADGELCQTPDELLDLWTRKESKFKAAGEGRFLPHKIVAAGDTTACVLSVGEPVYLALCSEVSARVRYYVYENRSARLMPSGYRKPGMVR
ncbi:MAG: hypothetical protein E7450_03930 [Ruminococcaceae bacterium]|nr:hypothetical protein [Oscillospiraceae bacterium]